MDKNEKPSRWAGVLRAVGLPEKPEEITDEMMPSRTVMPVAEFQKLLKLKGVVPGYTSNAAFQAGSSVLAWAMGGEYSSHDVDYFVRRIEDAETFARFLLGKNFELAGYMGNKKKAEEMAGNDWKPTLPIRTWYFGSPFFNTPSEKRLPMTTLPAVVNIKSDGVDQDYAAEYVTALNFTRKGTRQSNQIVLVIRGEPAEVIDTFDFSICQWAIDDGNIYFGGHTIQDVSRRKVRIHRIHHPMSTMRRVLKYSARGFFFCNGALLKVAGDLTHYAEERIERGLDPLEGQAISLD